MSKKRKPSKVSHNLVALSSAAVLTVYAAGFLRTRAAAERFADDTRRRPSTPGSEHEPPSRPAFEPSAAAPRLAPATTPRPAAAKGAVDVAARPAAVNAAEATDKAGTKASVSPSVRRDAVSVTAPIAAPVSVAAPPVVETAPAVTPSAVSEAAPAAALPLPALPSAPPSAAKWKDGSYTGWGTSRHGDIQATVVVANGRILSATITQCLTRYSCSWIEALPPQVVSRQSPETDYVSGATQSTNAFYYAVVEALSKAK